MTVRSLDLDESKKMFTEIRKQSQLKKIGIRLHLVTREMTRVEYESENINNLRQPNQT